MEKFIDEIKSFLPQVSDTLVLDVVTTVLLLLGVMLFKTLLIRIFSSQARLPFEIRKRRVIHIRNLMIFIFIVGVIFIWSKEIHAIAI